MDVASISALSALAGSVVGGLTSGFTTWLSQRAQARAGQLAHDKSQREDLYKDFIIAASKAYGDVMELDATLTGRTARRSETKNLARPAGRLRSMIANKPTKADRLRS